MYEKSIVVTILWTIKVKLREVKRLGRGHTATIGNAWTGTQSAGPVTLLDRRFNVTLYFHWSWQGSNRSTSHAAFRGTPDLKSRPAWHLNYFSKEEPGQLSFLMWGKKKGPWSRSLCLVCHLDYYPPPLTLHSLPTPPHLLCIQSHKILLCVLHWPNTQLQCWPGVCKLSLSGWLLYLYWFKLFPLPIHYAGIPPCWGQLCYSFLWLKPKNYLSNSLGTNPSRVNILIQMGPLLIPLPLAKSGTFPNQFTWWIFLREIEIGVEQESDGMPLNAESQKNVPEMTLVSVTLP